MEKNNCIISYNVNGYRPINKTITFQQKLKDMAKDIRDTYGLPLIIMFQEILAGRNMKYLDLIRCLYPEYELILPVGFDYETHYRSIIAVTLVRRDVLGSYRVIELDSELPNRVCYIAAELKGLGDFRILNIHLVQTQNLEFQAKWYVLDRKRLKEHQWNLLHNELNYIRELNVIFAGDMQESKNSPNLNKLIKDGYIVSGASGTRTVRNSFFDQEYYIDHIIFSSRAIAALGDGTEIIYDNSGVGKYSDHTLLCISHEVTPSF